MKELDKPTLGTLGHTSVSHDQGFATLQSEESASVEILDCSELQVNHRPQILRRRNGHRGSSVLVSGEEQERGFWLAKVVQV